jgi:hypothetical protein
MANRYAVANGNWSNVATWDGGTTIPGSGDSVRPNNFTVTIDQNITVTELTNNASSPAVGGGSFYANDGITITGNIASRLTSGIVLYVTGSNSCTIVGNITHTTFVSSGTAVRTENQANLTVSGSITVNTSTQSTNNGINHVSTGILQVTGSLNGVGGGGNQFCILNSSTGIVFFNGIMNIPTSPSSRRGIQNNSSGTIIVTGSITGNGIGNGSVGNIYFTGSITAGGDSGITSTTNGIISVIGPISSSVLANGVSSTGTGATNLFTGPFFNTGSFNAVYAYRMQMLEPTSTSWRFDTETAGVSKTLYTSNQLPGVPQQTDVRRGTQYNFGLTGSLEMPDPTTVKTGVAVDNTTGSAILTPQDMFDVATQTLTDSGSIGNLLTGASTVQTVGATISSFKV